MSTPFEILGDACNSENQDAIKETLRQFLESSPTSSQYYAAHKKISELAEKSGLKNVKLTVVTSFTADLLTQPLFLHQYLNGINLTLQYVPYDQWFLALSSKGQIDEFSPDLVFLLLHLNDVAPVISYSHLMDWINVTEEKEKFLKSLFSAISAFQQRSDATVIVGNFCSQKPGFERYFDLNTDLSKSQMIEDYNRELSSFCSTNNNILTFDYSGIVADYGRASWFDNVRNFSNKSAISSKAIPSLARELSNFLNSIQRPRKKVLAVDFDNTIWGGVVGEDGPMGVRLSGEYPGNAYHAFQTFLKNLSASGILLVATSKNNLEDAKEVFDQNPSMPLKWEDFVVHKIDWADKYLNLKAAADKLNLGIESFVFIDDNPVEIAMMRQFSPDVKCILLNGSPANFQDKIVRTGHFDSPTLTSEDFGRTLSYQADKKRGEHEIRTETIEKFLSELGLEISVFRSSNQDISRIAQLFEKTNQFNFTTKRYSLSEVTEMTQIDGIDLISFALKDKYGEYGIIAVVVLKHNEGAATIDSFLMSCRVLGRNIEDAILAVIEEVARERDADRLLGLYSPTAKNQQVEGFYVSKGFEGIEGSDSDCMFQRTLSAKTIYQIPPHTHISYPGES